MCDVPDYQSNKMGRRSGWNGFGLMFAMVFLVLSCGGGGAEGKRSRLTMEKKMEVESKLKLLNKPAVKTIQSEDGDIIDCVDIHKQPAFDHPMLQNHTIQMRPSHDLRGMVEEASAPSPSSSPHASIHVDLQTWRKKGSCPEGTIPIRRVQKQDLLRASSIDAYGKKPLRPIKRVEVMNNATIYALGLPDDHSITFLGTVGFSYLGAKANINVWNPRVEADDEYSTGQIWLQSGHYNDTDSIEAGWIVNPELYGDRRTRAFIYWTSDSGQTTGCFDLNCAGFVQTSTEIALGTAIEPISGYMGNQYHITWHIFKDDGTGNWWLVFRNNIIVGYWPNNLFDYLSRIAQIAEFGGDVYSPRMRVKPHTATQMGSGHYASDHWGEAAFIQEPRIQDYSKVLKYPEYEFIYPREPYCYPGYNWAEVRFTEPLFYFGGPGRNPLCT